jgi:hypothetical protein
MQVSLYFWRKRLGRKKNREERHHYIVIGRDKPYFVKSHS